MSARDRTPHSRSTKRKEEKRKHQQQQEPKPPANSNHTKKPKLVISVNQPPTPAVSSSSDAKTKPKDIPGFYFDEQKNRYFRIDEAYKARLREEKHQERVQRQITRRPVSRAGREIRDSCNIYPSIISRSLGLRSSIRSQIFSFLHVSSVTPIAHTVTTNVSDLDLHLTSGTILFGDSIGHLKMFQAAQPLDFPQPRCFAISPLLLNSPITAVRSRQNGLLCAIGLLGRTQPGGVRIFRRHGDHGLSPHLEHVDLNYSAEYGSVWTCEWHPQNAPLLSIGLTKGARCWNLETGHEVNIVTNKSDVFAQQWNQKGDLIFNGSRDGLVRIFDVRSKPLQGPPPLKHKAGVCDLHLMRSDENYLLSSAMMHQLVLWDRRMGKIVTEFESHVNEFLPQLRFATDFAEKTLFCGGQDLSLRIWSISTGKLLRSLSAITAQPVLKCLYGETWPNMTAGEESSASTSIQPGVWLADCSAMKFVSIGREKVSSSILF